jgi:prophage DNA circulation protein
MPTFRDDLRPASFRGVAFSVDNDESTFGNRTAKYEYPGRDGADHDQLGQMAQAYIVRAVVIGDGFLTAAAALEAALRKPGAGQLIHPHYGERTVVVLDVRRLHATSAEGEVSFQITFEETTSTDVPLQSIDTAAALGVSADNLFSAIEGQFNAFFTSANLPDFLLEDALTRANRFTQQAQSLMSREGVLNLIGGSLPTWAGVATGFASSVTDLFKQIAFIARPKSKPVIGSASTAAVTASQVRGILTALSSASDVRLTDGDGGYSESAAVRIKNASALDGLFRGAALASLGAAARYASYESREEAILFRGIAAEKLSSLREHYGTAGWDDAWKATGQQLAALSRDINERIGRLPRTVTVNPQSVRPSLALAHRLYGDDLDNVFIRAEDIIKRNGVRHPGFVPADDLEVLINAS